MELKQGGYYNRSLARYHCAKGTLKKILKKIVLYKPVIIAVDNLDTLEHPKSCPSVFLSPKEGLYHVYLAKPMLGG